MKARTLKVFVGLPFSSQESVSQGPRISVQYADKRASTEYARICDDGNSEFFARRNDCDV